MVWYGKTYIFLLYVHGHKYDKHQNNMKNMIKNDKYNIK